MAGWSGFSEEDLRKMHQKEPVSSSGRGRKPAPTNRSRQQLQRERALYQAAQQRDASAQLPPEQQLAKPAVRTPNQTAPKITPENKSEKRQLQEPVVVNHHSVPIPEPTIMAKELEKQEVELREKTRLELLQQEQRMMEEKNKRKKALLSKTIAEKSKQTQAEAVKLKKIQKELQALDDMVSNDIGILRGRIEQASWDYSTARKRYEKAEAEYVSAKLDLHSKTEVKEQLTEHLYTIIQENEQRKARKLEQLMRQLELQEDEERLELEIQVEHMLRQVEAQEEVETGGQVEGGGQVEVEVEVEVKAQVETDTPVESLLTESQPKTSNPPDSVAAEVAASPS
ncbi:RAB6-interacting golgin [Conger conger]|uniref:RAB6-interacting golgin n=1 Tax=Conger conger TaxID=82655 RepID=UPI002A5999C9|nr:RAB6-interacting golgin [Conger conger]